MHAVRLAAGAALTLLIAGLAPPVGAEPPPGDVVAALVADLGSADYAVREQAAARLEELGPDAADALLAAAEVSADLEVALRAQWLVQALPLASPDDPPAAAEWISRYERGNAAARRRIAHRLLRLDNDAGITPLARMVRFDRDATQARLAAALLAREWQPGDAYWPGIAARITAGIGGSQRPSARFLRALVAFAAADSPAGAAAALEEAGAAMAMLERHAGGDRATAAGPPADLDAADDDGTADEMAGDPPALATGDATTLRIFRRCLIEMLVTVGRRDEAIVQAAKLFAAAGDDDAADGRLAADLAWVTEHGLPEAVSLLETRWPDLGPDEPIAAYAAALATQRFGAGARAAVIADRAFARPRGATDEFAKRIQAALVLAKWGAVEWATREYLALVADERTPAAEFALASILFAEFLHDQGDDDRAATVLVPVLTGRAGRPDEEGDRILPRLERDPASVASRKLYFESCAAAAAGENDRSRELLEAAVHAHGKDVDALIALYRHLAGTPERPVVVELVGRALRQIEDQIQALPADANGYNEYAWLVANTEGDVAKAIRYSRISLAKSFDSASYLDTLAHCQAAAGDFPAAVRTQTLALRMEPHNRTILRNLMRFQARAAARQQP